MGEIEAKDPGASLSQAGLTANLDQTRKEAGDPTVLEKISFVERLRPLEVYRDGPRFFCAKVTDGEHEFQAKELTEALQHQPDAKDALYTPAYQLATEIEAAQFLSGHLTEERAIAPRLQKAELEPMPWYVTEHIAEGWLGIAESPFFYNLDQLAATPPETIFKSLAALQKLTDQPDIPARITEPRRSHKEVFNLEAAIAFYAQESQMSEAEVKDLVARATEIKAQQPLVLCHGEVFPQHIFAGPDHARLIDWENARLDDPYVDHVEVWLRAFELPEWQQQYFEMVSQQEGFNLEAWDATVFLMALDNHRSLTQNDQTAEARRLPAAKYCRGLIDQMAEKLH